MATNDILQFAGTATGADILTQAAYAASTDRPIGHQVGVAKRALENKALKQASTIAASLAQLVADAQANNIGDTLSVATLAGYIKTAIKNVSILACDAGGTANALTAAFAPATTALADGKFLIIQAAAANSSGTPTLAVDGLAAKTIVKGSNAALANGDIAGAGFYLLVSYNAGLDKYVLHNPAKGTSSSTRSILHVRDEKSSGTDGGTFTSGSWITRELGTVVTNTIAGASVASNIITMPAGTFKITATAPAHNTNNHQCRIIDNVYLNTLMVGTTENTTGSGSSSEIPTTTRSSITGVFTFFANQQIILQHQCSTTRSSYGLGSAFGFGENEVYAELFIESL